MSEDLNNSIEQYATAVPNGASSSKQVPKQANPPSVGTKHPTLSFGNLAFLNHKLTARRLLHATACPTRMPKKSGRSSSVLPCLAGLNYAVFATCRVLVVLGSKLDFHDISANNGTDGYKRSNIDVLSRVWRFACASLCYNVL